MQLTQFSDYSLRLLLYLGLKNERATVREVAHAYGISQNHLVKVARRLNLSGHIRSVKGRQGGLELACDPRLVKLGDFISQAEPHMDLVECFNLKQNTCPIVGVCRIEQLLYLARQAFIENLNQFTLADLLKTSPVHRERLKRLGLPNEAG